MRKKESIKNHQIAEDYKFRFVVVSRLINKIMKDGKKNKATNIFYSACEIIQDKLKVSPTDVLNEALNNIKPNLELKSWKIGGANYRIPRKISENRAFSVAMKWIVEGARKKKSSKPFYHKLAEEIIDSYNKTGSAYQKKELTNKEAMSNMAFARSIKI